MDLWNDLGFSLYAALPVCHMVVTLEKRKKSEIEVSTDWCITIFFFSQQFITWGAMAVRAYRRNYVWSINTLTFLYSYPTQKTTKELNP